jgi:hypothetical protein
MAFFIFNPHKNKKMNKKILVFAAVLFAFLGFVSCDEEDDTAYVSPNYIAGKWTLTEKGMLNSQNVLNYAPVENNGCAAEDITFNADFSFETTDTDFDGTNCNTTSQGGTYGFTPGNVVFTYVAGSPAETVTMTLKTLSDVELVLVTTDENGDIVFLKYAKVSE